MSGISLAHFRTEVSDMSLAHILTYSFYPCFLDLDRTAQEPHAHHEAIGQYFERSTRLYFTIPNFTVHSCITRLRYSDHGLDAAANVLSDRWACFPAMVLNVVLPCTGRQWRAASFHTCRTGVMLHCCAVYMKSC